MPYQEIRYELANDIAVVTLNRPDVMNALGTRMRAELTEALHRGGAEARAVVLTGAGRAFCAGQDLGDSKGSAGLDLERLLRDEYEPLLSALYDCPVPTITAVNGVAAGAGANIALAADVVIASENATFIQAFTRIGLMPDAGGTWWLPRQIGFARAMGAMLFGDKIPAKQAADWGMIWEAVPEADFIRHWRARAAHLAQGPTVAYRAIKQALRGGYGNDLRVQLALEAQSQGQCGATRDFNEGLMAFLEKRPAIFEGR
ncbi:enoyl-CoA hydratase-related protein [Phaeovulum sp.]|uniref:enoyl-CoA hydratase-related protein n=1 Tax=Phaeovulum sp. TaxID=2934796 RepID=UPI0039E3981E